MSNEPPETFYQIGRQYHLQKQYARAYEAFKKAAAANHPAATRALGSYSYHGMAVPKDTRNAMDLWERAIGLGDGPARALLGRHFIHGSSGWFLGGITRPLQVLRGIQLIFSGILDVWIWQQTSWEE